MEKKIILGMSGGVDSSVAALLLKKAGWSVTGLMLLLQPPSPAREAAMADARAAADQVGIPLFFDDRHEQFQKLVIQNFIDEYKNGCTPNPCVRCNPFVKFASLLAFAEKHGCTAVATGHYVKTDKTPMGHTRLLRHPSAKDQSYFLSYLTQEQADSAVFPLAAYTKDQVRAIAAESGVPCAAKKDSQEVCFIPGKDYASFLIHAGGLRAEPGYFLNTSGEKIGMHRGILHYTLGQRRGLEIAMGERMYVQSLDPKNNTVTLCREDERYITSLTVENPHWINGKPPEKPFSAQVKIRSTARPISAEITPLSETNWQITLSQKQTFAAPGQTAAFYDGDVLLGGARIL